MAVARLDPENVSEISFFGPSSLPSRGRDRRRGAGPREQGPGHASQAVGDESVGLPFDPSRHMGVPH